MILTKRTPFSKAEIETISEQFGSYIKTVIDIENTICSAGCDRHVDSEKILLNEGSKQEHLWGGGIDLESLSVDGNSFINIRPKQGNTSNEIQDGQIRIVFDKLMKDFFAVLYEK
jgi:hypothetical protein